MYTVVIVDDEPWALQGLAEIIDWNNEGFSIIGQFTDPDEAFEFLCKKEPLLSSMRSAGGVERRKVDSFICQRHRGCISESICRIPYN